MLDNLDRGDRGEVKVFPEFDLEWQKYYDKLSPRFGDLTSRLRARQRVFAFVGPRAIGKSYYIDRLIARYAGMLEGVKTNTTRKREPRDDIGRQAYNFMTPEDFGLGIKDGYFLEHDIYFGNHYGSSISEIYKVLDRGLHGIFAITPPGSAKLFEWRSKINLSIICLRPESVEVLLKNYDRRGIVDLGKREQYLSETKNFLPPNGVDYQTVWISGCLETDEARLVDALRL